MTPILAIVGCGKSGKTTLVEKLVAELVRRGYTVGTLKHDVHGFAIDHEGKDSWRHKRAGAQAVAVLGPEQVALVRSTPEGELSISEAVAMLGPVDIVIAEGFKRAPYPKIELFSSARNEGGLLCAGDPKLLAVVGDISVDTHLPAFDWNDAVAIVDFIVAHLF